MGLFSKKPAPIAETGYQDVVDYMRGLSHADYTKILKVVTIYRDADKGVKKVLGIKDNFVTEPSTADEIADLLLDDDDTTLGFLDDEPVKKPKGKKK